MDCVEQSLQGMLCMICLSSKGHRWKEFLGSDWCLAMYAMQFQPTKARILLLSWIQAERRLINPPPPPPPLVSRKQGGLVVSALDFQYGGWWLEPSLHCCVVSLFSWWATCLINRLYHIPIPPPPAPSMVRKSSLPGNLTARLPPCAQYEKSWARGGSGGVVWLDLTHILGFQKPQPRAVLALITPLICQTI